MQQLAMNLKMANLIMAETELKKQSIMLFQAT